VIYGVDVSAYQAEQFPVAGKSFAIIKATEGTGYVNPRLAAQTAWARQHGLSVGFYHFGHAGNVTAQVDYFLAHANAKPGDHLWFDWESTGGTHPSTAEKDQWIRLCKSKATGHKVGLYCNTSFWKSVDTTSYAGDGLWIADYTTPGKARVTDKWVVQQYTDSPLDSDVADFASLADMKAWAGAASTPAPAIAPQKYPGADLSHWYGDAYPGSQMNVNTLVWHTTETRVLPTYSGGAEAPTLTAVADTKTRTVKWYQHFDIDKSSRALVNLPGGVETNTLNVAQVELVGTCDPGTRDNWNAAGYRGQFIYWPEAPDWALAEVAKFVNWLESKHQVPIKSTVTWKAYPGSAGTANGVRLSNTAWLAYNGHLGHQHVPENLHGDPGNLDFARIIQLATGADVALSADDIRAIFSTDGIIPSPDDATDTNKFWTATSYLKATYLQAREAAQAADAVKVDAAAIKAAVAAIQVGGIDLDALAAKVADVLAHRLES